MERQQTSASALTLAEPFIRSDSIHHGGRPALFTLTAALEVTADPTVPLLPPGTASDTRGSRSTQFFTV